MKSILLIPSLNIVGRRLEAYVPYGILSLQAASRIVANVNVETAIPSDDTLNKQYGSHDEVADAILSDIDVLRFEAFGLSTVCNSIYHSLCIAKKIRAKHPKAIILFGGPYVTKIALEVLGAFGVVDAVFTGEAERSFVEFLQRWVRTGICDFQIDGVVSRGSTPCPAGVIENLDDLPDVLQNSDFFAWLDLVRHRSHEGVAVPLEATRGCPLPCSFCSTKQIWGAKVRRKSPSRLIREMTTVHARTQDTFFSLIGDNLGVPRAPFLSFCDDLAKIRGNFTWGCSLKLDRFQDGNLQAAFDAGCRAMFVGIESASQVTLDKVRKTASVENELMRIREAIELGIKIEASFIIGFPWERPEDVKATYELHCELLDAGAHRSQIGVLCPIPGTEIVAECEVRFDGWTSYVAQDDVPASADYENYVHKFPSLFSHLGHYPTPSISRVELKAYRDAASRIANLHKRNRRNNSADAQANETVGAMFG